MSSVSTFGSFTQARLAIYASQAGLTVTGNNISNINTEGYTRQRLDQTSFYAGSSDRYSSELSLRIGYGTLATGVSQLRDPYLDIRYRNEASSVGYSDATLSVLEQIESILDEVGDGEDDFGIIADQLSDLYNALSQLNDQTGHDEYDILVRTSAQTLTNLLNSYSAQLEEVYNNTVDAFNTDVGAVNTVLKQIQGLNENIRKAELYGDKALELRDERNLLLDKLATYVNINVRYEYESIGAGVEVEKLMVEIEGTDTKLVDGIYVRQLQAKFPQVNPDTLPYLDANGDPTAVPTVDANGVPTTNPDDAKPNPDYDPAALPYLDVNGKPVADVADAKLVNTDNFDIELTALTDSKGRLQYTTEKGAAYAGFALTDLVTQLNATYKTSINEAAVGPSPITCLLEDGSTLIVTYSSTSTEAIDPGTGTMTTTTTYAAQAYIQTPSTGMELGDNVLFGSLQALREMLTEEGEFASADDIKIDPDAATKRGIPYYQQTLDLFAYQIAKVFNDANTQDSREEMYATELDANGIRVYKLNFDGCALEGQIKDDTGNLVTFKDDDGNTINATYKMTLSELEKRLPADVFDSIKDKVEDLQDDHLSLDGTYQHGYRLPAMGGPLFSNNGDGNDPTGITAANISISKDWSNGPLIVNSWNAYGDLGVGSTDSSNILHMIALMNSDQNYDPTTVGKGDAVSSSMFTGSFSEYWNNVGITLGKDMSTTSTLLDTHYATAVELESSRDSVSAVDLNDEAMNLTMYQQAYNAACRLMTTLDSVLDKLVNNTGVT